MALPSSALAANCSKTRLGVGRRMRPSVWSGEHERLSSGRRREQHASSGDHFEHKRSGRCRRRARVVRSGAVFFCWQGCDESHLVTLEAIAFIHPNADRAQKARALDSRHQTDDDGCDPTRWSPQTIQLEVRPQTASGHSRESSILRTIFAVRNFHNG